MPDGLKPLVRMPALPAKEDTPVHIASFFHALSVKSTGTDPLFAASAAKDDVTLSRAKGTVAAVADAIQGMALPVPIQAQEGNACGTTSLSMVLNYFGASQRVANVKTIDAAIRPSSNDRKIDSFTAPIDLVLYAQRSGFNATLHNHSTTMDLKLALAQGVPPIILFDLDAPKGTGLHYVVVSGSRISEGKREWQLTDPWGKAWYIDEAELMRRWSNLHVNGVQIPYDRAMITVAPKQGLLKTPIGTVKPAADVKFPTYNGSLVVDLGASVATWGIGVGADAYDAAKWVSSTTQSGVAALKSGWNHVTSAVGGLVH